MKYYERLDGVHPSLVALCFELDKVTPICIVCGPRTNAQQHALYEQGRTKPGKIVTHADSGQSPHNCLPLSMAVDIGPDPLDWNDAKEWAHVINAAKDIVKRLALDIEFGDDWKGPKKDTPHIQMKGWKS